MEMKKDQDIIPAAAPFQHVVLSSNPLGIQKGVMPRESSAER